MQPDGNRYEGQFAGGKPHGHGVLVRTSPSAFVVHAGTFEAGEPKVSPKDEFKLMAVSLAIQEVRRGLPDLLAAARDGFADARGDCGPSPPEGGYYGKESCQTDLGRRFVRDPRIEGDPGGRPKAWVAHFARSESVVGAMTEGMLMCATVAAVLGRSGDPWRASHGGQDLEQCTMVAPSGPDEGTEVRVLSVSKDAEGKFAVTLVVHPTKQPEG